MAEQFGMLAGFSSVMGMSEPHTFPSHSEPADSEPIYTCIGKSLNMLQAEDRKYH